MNDALKYPARPPYFAMKFIRAMVKACVANEFGPQVFTLLTTVAATEDRAKYLRAVTFYDSQLMPLIGAQSQDTLARIRSKAMAAGWLAYEPGRKGVPGSYFVLIPQSAAAFTDAPVDENPAELVADSSAPVRTQSRQKQIPPHGCGQKPGESAYATATEAGRMCGPSLPMPLPIHEEDSSEPAKPPASEPTVATASKTKAKNPTMPPADSGDILLTFPTVGAGGGSWPLYASRLDEWRAAFPGIDPLAEARKALAWINANPAKRKTPAGMPKFLVNWFGRAQDNAGRTGTANGPHRGPTTHPGYDRVPGQPARILPPQPLKLDPKPTVKAPAAAEGGGF